MGFILVIDALRHLHAPRSKPDVGILGTHWRRSETWQEKVIG